MRDLFIEIGESLRRNKLRSILTGFSVSWGIFMIILLLGAGNGLVNSFDQGGGDILVNTMMFGGNRTTMPYDGLQSGRRIRLDEKDLAVTTSKEFSDHIDDVSPSISRSGLRADYGKRHYKGDISLEGVNPEYFALNKIKVISGRGINNNDLDQGRKAIVISQNHVKNFTEDDQAWKSFVGKRIKVGDIHFTVVGVYESRDNSLWETMYVPYSTLKILFSRDNEIDNITFSFHGLTTQEENEQFEAEFRRAINTIHRANPEDRGAIWIWNRFTQNMQMEKVTGILNLALWIIGMLTLLGGVVSVSNIMLIAVRERKHEFGIRKAIGASPGQLIKLILAESVTLTAVFGYLGMVLGMVACEILDMTVGQKSMSVLGEEIRLLVNPTVGMDVAVEATVLLVVAGCLAGLFPALKAARVRPVEALKSN